jgi:hypothetical protein
MHKSIKRLEELKVKLVTATDFFEVFNYFFDHFGENEDFMDRGVRKHNDYIQQVLVASAQQVLKTSKVVTHHPLMIYVKEQRFYHGAIWFNQILANFFYFEDINAGLMALAQVTGSSETAVIRFSLDEIGKKREPSRN